MRRNARGGILGDLSAQDALVLVTVVALPWFWGGVYPDAYRTAAALIACGAGLALARRGASGLGLDRGASWLIPAFLLGALALAQVVPLPRTWVAALSPKAAAIQSSAFGPEGQGGVAWLRQIENDARSRVPEAASASAHPKGPLELGPDPPAPPERFTLSLRPGATIEALWWYTALLLAFLFVARRTANGRRAAAYRAVLFASFGVLAMVGIVNHVTSPQSLVWLTNAPREAHPFGPYVNPSHFAGVMELAVPWMLGFGLWRLQQPGQGERRRLAGALAIAGAIAGATAALLAASKMAAMSIALASGVLLIVAIRSGRGRRWLVAGAVAGALLLGTIAMVGPLRGRLTDFAAIRGGELSPNIRGLAWTAGLELANDYKLTGSGFSAFTDVIPAYLPRGESERWTALHNDYLEVYAAGGLIGAALVAWLSVAFAVRVVRVLRRDAARDRLLPSLGLALGLFALALHEAVDFNLQIPANALLFVVIAAMGVAPLAERAEGA